MAANTSSSPAATSQQVTVTTTGTSPPVAYIANPPFWSWFSEYLNVIIGIAALGGQITFTVIVSDIADPSTLDTSSSNSNNNDAPAEPDAVLFSKEKVRFFIALSWLFFTATLGLAVVAKILFANGPSAPSCSIVRKPSWWFSWVYGALTLLLNALPIAAFLLLALATSAYVPVVGWVGVAFISLFGVAVLGLWSVLDAGLW